MVALLCALISVSVIINDHCFDTEIYCTQKAEVHSGKMLIEIGVLL